MISAEGPAKRRGGRTVGRDGTPADKSIFTSTMEMNAIGTFNVTRLAAAAPWARASRLPARTGGYPRGAHASIR